MLQEKIIPALHQLGMPVFFQQDEATAHFSLPVRRYLDATFPSRWIGRGGPVAWAARLPDLYI